MRRFEYFVKHFFFFVFFASLGIYMRCSARGRTIAKRKWADKAYLLLRMPESDAPPRRATDRSVS
jgi:hypothetical protein